MIVTQITGFINLFPAIQKCTIVVLVHVDHIVITGMVHNDIHDDTDTMFMSGINQCFKFGLSTISGIRLGIVGYIVTMI